MLKHTSLSLSPSHTLSLSISVFWTSLQYKYSKCRIPYLYIGWLIRLWQYVHNWIKCPELTLWFDLFSCGRQIRLNRLVCTSHFCRFHVLLLAIKQLSRYSEHVSRINRHHKYHSIEQYVKYLFLFLKPQFSSCNYWERHSTMLSAP